MIEVVYNEQKDHLPMELLDDIVKHLGNGAHIETGVDVDYHVYVYIRNLDRRKGNGFVEDITGRGETYKDACISLLYQLLDKRFTLHFYKGYRSKMIRDLIKNSLFLTYYPINPNTES